MKLTSRKHFFQPRARLLLQLGDKLIKNENIALLELIKNAYDADARKVTITLYKVHSRSEGRIEIVDDGEGMDIEIIENVWLEPGSDHKVELFNSGKRTKKYKRLPIGEKGIGRFGVHKLGNKIELTSKKENKTEVVVNINWTEFEKNKYLKDAKIDVFERTTPEYFLRTRKGTRIVISDLRSEWDRVMIRDFYKSVFTLNSPFARIGKFNVEIKIDDNDSLKGLPQWSDIKQFHLFHFKCKISGMSITDFEYSFEPWHSLSKIKPKLVSSDDKFIKDNSTLQVKKKDAHKEDVLNLGRNYGSRDDPKVLENILFEGYIFDRDKKILDLGWHLGHSLLKEYLDEQGGIRVYRDNIRINEYGEKGNDWLSLDSRRYNFPTKRVSNNIILGVVDLQSEKSTALIEKSNREGFIENEAFKDFCSALIQVLSLVETLREIDKNEIRNKYNPSEKNEPVLFYLGELRDIVEEQVKNEKLKTNIKNHLAKIEEDYNHLQEILLTSAGAGLALGVGIHEVQKVILELNQVVKREKLPPKVIELIKHLDKLIENYSDLLKQSNNEKEDIVKIVDAALFNIEYRLEAHNITVLKLYKQFKGNRALKCSRRLMLGAILNLIDNSIYWLERKYKTSTKVKEEFAKKLLIKIEQNQKGFLQIIFADNGTGYSLPTAQITKPFITSKPDGMGLGLHITSEIVRAQGGQILFPEPEEYRLPKEFRDGATVVLKLKS